MAEDLHPGDQVSWKYAGQNVDGVVEKKLTAPTTIKGHLAQASAEKPEYLVHSNKTGAPAAHTPDSLTRRSSKSS